MMIPCQLSTFSEFICSACQFQGHLAQKISKCMKNTKWSQKGLKIDDVAMNGSFWTQKKSGVQISSKKIKSLCNRRVFVRNPDTSKEIVHFVHEVHTVFAVTLSTFLHMLCGWHDDTMPTFNLFRVHLKCFHVLWFETLILRKWLSILYTKCIQYLP